MNSFVTAMTEQMETAAGKALAEQIGNMLSEFPEADRKRAFACACVSQIFLPYALHVVEDAHSRQTDGLYFLAGDGYALKQICDALIRNRGYQNLRTRYLYGSAKAWRPLEEKKKKKARKDEEIRRTIAVRYIREEVDFSERFSVVGYRENEKTAQNLRDTLMEAAGHGYFYRTYWMFSAQEMSNLDTDRFTREPAKPVRRMLEVVNGNQPVKKVNAYDPRGNLVEPVFAFRECDADLDKAIREETVRLAETMELPEAGETEAFCREVYAFITGYYASNQADRLFLDTMATMIVHNKDGSTREFAPEITLEDIRKRIFHHKEFLTDSKAMSVERSSSVVQYFYRKWKKK